MPCCEGKAVYRRCTCSPADKAYRRLVTTLGMPDRSGTIAPCDLPAEVTRLRRLAAGRGERAG